MTIVAIASSSETTMTKKTMISNKEIMKIVTIVSSSKTRMVIRTMITNKEMLTSVTFVHSSELRLRRRNETIITIVTVASNKEAIDDIEDNDWK